MRFEIPACYRHFRDIVVRYPRWDLSLVDMVDPRDGTILARLFPLDRTANADGRRRNIDPGPEELPTGSAPRPPSDLPPLLPKQRVASSISATTRARWSFK